MLLMHAYEEGDKLLASDKEEEEEQEEQEVMEHKTVRRRMEKGKDIRFRSVG